MPRALFHVWRFEGKLSFKPTIVSQTHLGSGRLLSWPEGPAAAVQLTLSVPAGSAVLSAFSAARGAGHLVDQRIVAGPVAALTMTLAGSPVGSIVVEGNATINQTAVIPMNTLVNDPGWRLVERVGLPATSPAFDGSGYPLDPQGPVGSEVDPVEAATRRVKGGTPDTGWPATTDRGTSPEAFVAPDAELLVTKELRPLVDAVAELLRLVAEPSQQAEGEVSIATTAPRSVHGVNASTVWQSRARPSTIKPLGIMLVAAGADPFAALALGFGTTFDLQVSREFTLAQTSRMPVVFMITVEHKVLLKLKVPPLPTPVTITLAGELAAVYLGERPALPASPAGLMAVPSTTNPRLDPPGTIDGAWLEVVELSWALPVTPIGSLARPCGYAIARGFPGAPMEIRTEKRLSGGWTSFVPATSAGSEQPTSIRFTETGVPEVFPGDPPTFVYSVVAHDWFGRWSGWVSTDHSRVSVPPQIPAMRKVALTIQDTGLATYNAAAAVEFSWDWSHRRPAQIHLRILMHEEGSAPPAVAGSALSVGGPTVPDLILNFAAAGINTPPVGVDLIAEESLGTLRTYQTVIEGIQLAFGAHPKIQVTARARATERVVPMRLSAWSRDVQTGAASPIPPPPPFVPASMWWSSVPDPRGVSRTTLQWAVTAPLYAVYVADETALLRELDLPSPDLEMPSADRLPALRALNFESARRAFRRIADRIPVNSLEVALPRGSKLIHFYGVVPISSTGVEGSLPASGNSYFAVASPVVKTPEVPRVVARDAGGVVSIRVEAPELRVQVGRIEIFRAPSRHRAVSVEDSGPPIASVDASLGVRSGGIIRWEISDPSPGPAWQSVYYRAVAYGVADRTRGEYGGKSLPSPAIEVVPSSPLPPPVSDLTVEDIPEEPDYRLVSFLSDVTLARTPRGVHSFAVQTVELDASVTTRRAVADSLQLVSATLPGPDEQPDSIFRFDPVNPRAGRTYAWVPRDLRGVTVEITDPANRTTRRTWVAP
jgi:hypothetical protein